MPRLPWHDVHVTLLGPAVQDIVHHVVERWNEIKIRKVLSVTLKLKLITDVDRF